MNNPDQLEEDREQGTKTPTEGEREVVQDTEKPPSQLEKEAATTVARSLRPRESIKPP